MTKRINYQEVERVKADVLKKIRATVDSWVGKPGSVERAQGSIEALTHLLIIAVMARHGVSLDDYEKTTSLARHILDAIEDWEAQHTK